VRWVYPHHYKMWVQFISPLLLSPVQCNQWIHLKFSEIT
jgi:hypothetical protein